MNQWPRNARCSYNSNNSISNKEANVLGNSIRRTYVLLEIEITAKNRLLRYNSDSHVISKYIFLFAKSFRGTQ